MASHSLFSPAATCSHHHSLNKPDPFSSIIHIPTHTFHSQWLGITISPLQHSCIRPFLPKTRPVSATVAFSLPTANPERISSSDKVPKWSLKGIKSFAMGELEARKLKFATTGTEAILMGILVEVVVISLKPITEKCEQLIPPYVVVISLKPITEKCEQLIPPYGTNRASKLLRANGFTLSKVREEAIKLIGKPDYFYFSPEHPPLTESAQKALDWAVDEKLKSGDDGEITTSHLLLGVWSEKEGAGYKIMATLGFNDEKAQELHSLISKPGFIED